MQQSLISNRIRDLRISRNMTQAELGQVVGVSMQAVSKWERGGLPDIGILIVLADYFKVSLDELLGRTPPNQCSVNDTVYQTVLHASPENTFEQACDFCWSAVKGTTGIPDIEAMGYTSARSLENSRCRIATNDGIAYGILTDDFHMLSILPEPKEGFRAQIGNIEDYADLFRMLSDKDTLLLFQFIGTRTQALFSMQLAVQETGISEFKVERIFDEFTHRGWIAKEIADTDSGALTLYRAFFQPSFIFFQIYAQELLLNPRFWYLSSCSQRTKPLLSPVQPSDH